MSKHTPGPWEAISNLVRTRCTSDGNGGFLIAECPPNIGDRLENARLIAAAPDMLKALQEIVAAADGDGWSQLDATLAKARAAIAKATGGAA